MQIRVDWDGDLANNGRFDVFTTTGDWQPCGNLDPESPFNDLILVQPQANSGKFTVCLTRGPDNTQVPFEAWVRRIEWIIDTQADPEYGRPSFTPKRGVHYRYHTESVYNHELSKIVKNVQQVSLQLNTNHDYELWTKLRHPTNLNIWCIQDPMIDPTDPDPGPEPNERDI